MKKRTWYRTKSAWAAAELAKCEEGAQRWERMARESADRRGYARAMETADALRAEAAKWMERRDRFLEQEGAKAA